MAGGLIPEKTARQVMGILRCVCGIGAHILHELWKGSRAAFIVFCLLDVGYSELAVRPLRRSIRFLHGI